MEKPADSLLDGPRRHAPKSAHQHYTAQPVVSELERDDPRLAFGRDKSLDAVVIGIDVTHLAISLIERRLREAFAGIRFETIGVPKDIGGARALADKDKHEFQKWAITLIPDAQPWKGGRKGADTGIDGIVYLRTGKSQSHRAIIEVKGGEHVGVDVVHKLKSVVEREKALVGLLVTLNPPSAQAEKEAVAAGYEEVDMGTGSARFRKIQILTVEELMNGARANLPIVDNTAFRRAKRESSVKQSELDL